MSEWQECKLGVLVSLEYGRSLGGYQESNGKYPVYGTNGKIGNTDSLLSSIPSVIIGRKGAYRGIHFSKCPFFVIDTAFYVKPKTENLDLLFLYNFLLTQDINAMDSGSAIPSTDRYEIYDLDILLPPLPEQRAIAGVLSSLDDKIDLLHRQNKTLEGMAEALWRKMFVEEAANRWPIAKLGDFCEIQNGYAFKSSEYQEYQLGYLEVLKMGHIQPGGGLRSDPKRDYVPPNNKLKRWILNKDDIVLPMTDMKDNVVILGNPALIDKDGTYVLNQRVARITIKDKSILVNPYMLYLQMKDREFISELQSKANSGVQVNLTTEAIKESNIIIPPDDVQLDASENIIGYYNKFDLNTQQIRILSRLRDTLLPKLMSGEVRVKI